MNRKKKKIDISIVVPFYNEEENVSPLYHNVKKVMDRLEQTYELIFIDDGSQDDTRQVLRSLAGKDPNLHVILFRRNFGQSAAMAAGFRNCQGQVVVTLDGDLQNDPEDIPRLLQKLNEGYDVVSGWRKNRKDTLILRKIPSQIANRLICSITGIRLHDTGCALKIYRKEVIDQIRLYGELHRFLPALTSIEGARISELVVNHYSRKFGYSKYNLSRTFRVLMDLTSLHLFIKYLRNPFRYFGCVGFGFFGLGFVGSLWLAFKIGIHHRPFIELNVPVTLIFLLMVVGFQFIFIGLIATLIVNTGDRHGHALNSLTPKRKSHENES